MGTIEKSPLRDCYTDNDIIERRYGLSTNLTVAYAMGSQLLPHNVHFEQLPPTETVADIVQIAS